MLGNRIAVGSVEYDAVSSFQAIQRAIPRYLLVIESHGAVRYAPGGKVLGAEMRMD